MRPRDLEVANLNTAADAAGVIPLDTENDTKKLPLNKLLLVGSAQIVMKSDTGKLVKVKLIEVSTGVFTLEYEAEQ